MPCIGRGIHHIIRLFQVLLRLSLWKSGIFCVGGGRRLAYQEYIFEIGLYSSTQLHEEYSLCNIWSHF